MNVDSKKHLFKSVFNIYTSKKNTEEKMVHGYKKSIIILYFIQRFSSILALYNF